MAGTANFFTPSTSERKTLRLQVTALCKCKLLNLLSYLFIPTLAADMNPLSACLIIHLYVSLYCILIHATRKTEKELTSLLTE